MEILFVVSCIPFSSSSMQITKKEQKTRLIREWRWDNGSATSEHQTKYGTIRYLEATQVVCRVVVAWARGRFPFMWNKINVFNRNTTRAERGRAGASSLMRLNFESEQINRIHMCTSFAVYYVVEIAVVVIVVASRHRLHRKPPRQHKKKSCESSERVHDKTENVFGWIGSGYVFKWLFFFVSFLLFIPNSPSSVFRLCFCGKKI